MCPVFAFHHSILTMIHKRIPIIVLVIMAFRPTVQVKPTQSVSFIKGSPETLTQETTQNVQLVNGYSTK